MDGAMGGGTGEREGRKRRKGAGACNWVGKGYGARTCKAVPQPLRGVVSGRSAAW